jgi:enoyl-CoA hydratase/carnithine racemase
VETQPLVLIERRDAVASITLNRPERRNALDIPMREAIAAAFEALAADAGVLAIVVTGGDKVFAAGADLKMLVDQGPQQALELARYWVPVAQCPKPLIAAVQGYALGAGCELAMMCDIVVADAEASFGQPECNVGIIPGAGGIQRLVRRVGLPVASLMLMAAAPLKGERACQLGLVSELAELGGAFRRALELAEGIARMPPKAIAAIKRVLRHATDLPLEQALLLENREFALLFDTQDKTEGMRAFLEKRRPNFKGN